jgi:thiamine pyrophosphate-dependent acetolactate synthase large subunit-like protein
VKRHECLKEIADLVGDALCVVCVGGTSSEWNAYHPSDGNLRCWTLGLTSSVALGMALGLPRRRVIAFDGDGSLLMNLCGLPTAMRKKPKNLIHVVFDNGIYESSGGTKTASADGVDFAAVAKGIGIHRAFNATSVTEFKNLFIVGVRHYVLRNVEEIEWTFKNAWILAEDSSRPVAVLLTKDVLGKR